MLVSSWPEFSARYAIAPDVLLTHTGPVQEHVVEVTNDKISLILPLAEYERRHPDRPVSRLTGKAIIPGFCDAHVHLGQGFGKAITAGEPAQIWQRIWIPLEGHLDPDLCYISAKWMFLEALRGGFTTIVDFAIINAEKTEAIHRAAADTGIRLVSSTGSVDRADYPPLSRKPPSFASISDALKRADAHFEMCKGKPRITPSLAASGVQGASTEMIKTLSDYCRDRGAVFQIHACEHHPEVHASILSYGKRPIEVFADAGALGPSTLLHHVAIVSAHEIELIHQSKSAFTYNPLACAWKLDAVTPALTFAERGMRMGMGTDSTRADGFRMLEAAETIQRVTKGMETIDFSCGAGWTWVDAATRGGADAAGLGHVTGSLKPGMQADFLVLSMETPEVLPSWDFEWELVRLYNRDQIEAVVIDGQLIMKDRTAVGWDQDKFIRDSLPRAMHTVTSAPINRRHGISSSKRPPER